MPETTKTYANIEILQGADYEITVTLDNNTVDENQLGAHVANISGLDPDGDGSGVSVIKFGATGSELGILGNPSFAGLTLNGQNAGNLLDNFKNELPQSTPWKENTFKYSLSNLYPLGKKFAISGMYSFLKVKRKNYLINPNKKDYTKNHILDISFLYQLQKNSILYLKISASSNYLLGENPLAYNRRSNHLFDHPYGQVYAGLLFNF